MPIQTTCPSCSRTLRVPDDLIGQAVRCPSCAAEWKVETPSPAEAPPPSESPPSDDSPAIPSEGIREAATGSVATPPAAPSPPAPPPDDQEDEDEDDPAYLDRLEDHRRKRLRRSNKEKSKSKVMGPAIGLIVAAGGHILSALYCIANGAMSMAVFAGMPRPAGPGPGATPLYVISGGYILGGLLLAIVGGLTLYGAIEMLRLRKYQLAMTSSILALVPCNCCFGLVGIPFGVWGLVVLLDANVKAAFMGSDRMMTGSEE